MDVLAIGNAIVDVLCPTEEDFLGEFGLTKGTMQLIDADRAEALYSAMGPAVEASGGGAANTVVGVASLGGSASFVGRVANDQLGAVFTHDIRAAGVRFDVAPANDGEPTGRCLILITPDAERTMNTFLGAAAQLSVHDVEPDEVAAASVTFLEGFLWDPPAARAALRAAAEAAHAAGQRVAFTLNDAFLVNRFRADFLEFLSTSVDIAFANEAEVTALFEEADVDRAARQLGRLCPLAAVTRGAHGSVVIEGGEPTAVPAAPVDEVVDTTGAGDLYAAGFLFGLTHGESPARAAAIGSLAASEVIAHVGPRPQRRLADLL